MQYSMFADDAGYDFDALQQSRDPRRRGAAALVLLAMGGLGYSGDVNNFAGLDVFLKYVRSLPRLDSYTGDRANVHVGPMSINPRIRRNNA
jgi:hypothetical protein